ncbi:MAG: haloacid dehalogenase, partial [Chloroflexota bacterium]|nr:haloacid dehalogenase [Chloroflexota bacterium]
MPTRAVLFDLDGTLLDDRAATRDALRATAALAVRAGLTTEPLANAAWLRALDGWEHSPHRDYFETFGISAGECLWG